MPDHADDALVSRVRLIEDQPLETRAASFAALHDELQQALEQADAVGRGGQRP
ncbi:hypothetical protein [Desertivibrio insolitus]|uniref:hypothetical protein n=1 Tax=Herbiconiux sp. SYSU D00978 TaxID=2812562 RepID=UPI001A9651E6|nr:hypothetical protein [Herbiconiux sp. SYSU D00978]